MRGSLGSGPVGSRGAELAEFARGIAPVAGPKRSTARSLINSKPKRPPQWSERFLSAIITTSRTQPWPDMPVPGSPSRRRARLTAWVAAAA